MAEETGTDEKARPEFSMEMAWKVYQKKMLVGLTYLDAEGNVIERKQVHGVVVRANPKDGFVLRLADGTEYALPPDFAPSKKQNRGSIACIAQGEVVVDPDFLATYTVTRRMKQ